jgi:hypothetical protein
LERLCTSLHNSVTSFEDVSFSFPTSRLAKAAVMYQKIEKGYVNNKRANIILLGMKENVFQGSLLYNL